MAGQVKARQASWRINRGLDLYPTIRRHSPGHCTIKTRALARTMSPRCLIGIWFRSVLLPKTGLSQRSGLVAYLLNSDTTASRI